MWGSVLKDVFIDRRMPEVAKEPSNSRMKSLTTRHYVYIGALILLALVHAWVSASNVSTTRRFRAS